MKDAEKSLKVPLILTPKGKTGRRVVERFKTSGLSFRKGSRSSKIPFDWNDESTWVKALTGISTVYVVFSPDLAVPGTTMIIKDFAEVAKECGVEHLILLSGRGEEEAQACEKIIINSGMHWTIVRSSWFAQNFSESFFMESILKGKLAIPVGDIKEPFVDIEDVADIIFAAFTDHKHLGKIYEVTGPDLLTFQDVIIKINSVTRRDLKYQQVSLEDYVNALSSLEVPVEYIGLLSYLFTEVLDGRNAKVTDGVFDALGRPPRSFDSYVKKTSDLNIWDSPN